MEVAEGFGGCGCSSFCSPAAMTVCAHVLRVQVFIFAKIPFGYSACPIQIIFSACKIHFYSGCFR